MTPWVQDGAVIVDSSGRVVLCDHCPCEEVLSFSGCGFLDVPVPRHLYLWYGRDADDDGNPIPPHTNGPITLTFHGTEGSSQPLFYSASIGGFEYSFGYSDICELCIIAQIGIDLLPEGGSCVRTLRYCCPTVDTSPTELFNSNLYYGINTGLRDLFQAPCLNKGYDWLYVTTAFGGLKPASFNGCGRGF